MGIKTFSPELAGIANEHDLEKKMIHSDVISHADVQAYADYIIGQLKTLKNSSEEEKESFVVDAFNEDNIETMVWNERMKGNPLLVDPKEVLSAIRRVRQAIVEELKGKIDEKIYFVIKDLIGDGSRTRVTGDAGRKNIINQVVAIESGKEKVFKEQELLLPKHKDATAEAVALFKQLDPHPNIAGIKEYDPATQRIIYEKLNLQTLDEYFREGNKNKEQLVAGLKIVKDCLAGAQYLADNGLVLQDIKISNLGVVTEEDAIKGALFDLEGLTKEGVIINGRMGPPGKKWLPPEIRRATPEAIQDHGWKIKQGEMVYQFGRCLQEILALYEFKQVFDLSDKNAIVKLESLVKKMMEKDPENRIGLAEAKNELEDIIANLQ